MKQVIQGALLPVLASVSAGTLATVTGTANRILSVVPDKSLTSIAIAASTTAVTKNVTKILGDSIIHSLGLENDASAHFVNNLLSEVLGFSAGVAAGACFFSTYDAFTASDRPPVGLNIPHNDEM